MIGVLPPPASSTKSQNEDEDSKSDSSDASGGSKGTEMCESKRKRLREVEASTYLNFSVLKPTWCSLRSLASHVPVRKLTSFSM